MKTTSAFTTVRLGDVATVEIGKETYGGDRGVGANVLGFGANPASGANAVGTVAAVRAKQAGIAPALPEGVEIQCAYDTSTFVELSIQKLVDTLIEAIGLVFLMILIFFAKLLRDADPDRCGSGRVAGHRWGVVGDGVFLQHADHVCHGSGDRSAGR